MLKIAVSDRAFLIVCPARLDWYHRNYPVAPRLRVSNGSDTPLTAKSRLPAMRLPVTHRNSKGGRLIHNSSHLLRFPQEQFTNQPTWSVRTEHPTGGAGAYALRPPEPSSEERRDGRRHE